MDQRWIFKQRGVKLVAYGAGNRALSDQSQGSAESRGMSYSHVPPQSWIPSPGTYVSLGGGFTASSGPLRPMCAGLVDAGELGNSGALREFCKGNCGVSPQLAMQTVSSGACVDTGP